MTKKPAKSPYKEKLENLIKTTPKHQRSIYIEDEIWSRFQQVCKAEGVSASEVVEAMISKFLEIPPEKSK